MKETEKYRYLTEYQIKTIKKENTAEILKRINTIYEREHKNKFDNQINGDIQLRIFKDGANLHIINIKQDDTEFGCYDFADIKEIVYHFQKIYQDGNNNIKAIINISDEWDETEDTPV